MAYHFCFSHYQFLFCLGSAFNGCYTGVLKCFVPQIIDLCFVEARSETYKKIALVILDVGAIALGFPSYFSLEATSLVNIFLFLVFVQFLLWLLHSIIFVCAENPIWVCDHTCSIRVERRIHLLL